MCSVLTTTHTTKLVCFFIHSVYCTRSLSDYSFLLSMSHNIPFLLAYWLLFGFVKGRKSQSEKPPLFCHAVLFVSIPSLSPSLYHLSISPFILWKKGSCSGLEMFVFLQETSIFRKRQTKHF